jgi:hypothetical protein
MGIDSIIMVITLTDNRREYYNYICIIIVNIAIVSSIVIIIYLRVITLRIEHHYEITAISYYYPNIFQSRNYGRSFKAK